MKKTTRIITSALASVMLVSGGTLPAAAEGGMLGSESEGYAYSIGGLATPKIVSTSRGRAHIKLRWSKVKGASGYRIYRKTSSGSYKWIKTVNGANNLTVLMDGFNSHTKYTFKVRAYKKSGGKRTFSKYSAAKAVITKYGTGANNYSCEQFKIKLDSKEWDFGENLWDFDSEYDAYTQGIHRVEFGLKDSKREYHSGDHIGQTFYMLGGWIDVAKMNKAEKGKSLKYFAEKFKEEHDDNTDYGETLIGYGDHYSIKYGKKFGTKCAFLYNTGTWDNGENGTSPLIMICKDGYIYTMRAFYDPAYYMFNDEYNNEEEVRKVVEEALDKLVLT